MKNILIHGNIAFDRIMNFPQYFKDSIVEDKIHELSVSFNINQMDVLRGGTGGNISYNLAMLGVPAHVLITVGEDAREYIKELERKGVQTDTIEFTDTVDTAHCTIITDRANNQITAFYEGASAIQTNCDLSQFDSEDTLICFSPANNKADTLKYIAEAKRLGIRYIFDPGQTTGEFNGKELKECIRGSYILIANDYEIELINKKTGLDEDALLDRTEVLVVTLGAKGSMIRTRDGKVFDIDAFPQETIVDPTGAGDAYRAGFIAGLSAGQNLEECGRLGACAASFAIEQVGTQAHSFTLASFVRKYEGHFDHSCPLQQRS